MKIKPGDTIPIPITREDSDGEIVDGFAALTFDGQGGVSVHSFVDLDSKPLMLPPGSGFKIPTDLVEGALWVAADNVKPWWRRWLGY